MWRRPLPAWVLATVAAVLAVAPSARATFPGRNGLLALPDVHIPYVIGIARISSSGRAVDLESRRTSFYFGCVINTNIDSGPCFNGRRSPSSAGRPSFSPDGRELVFDDGLHLDFLRASGTGFRKLAPLTARDEHATWFAGGRRVVFTGHPNRSTAGPVLFSVRPDGTGLRRLATRGDDASVSPNGRLIAFDRPGRRGRRNVWLMRADGSDQRMLAINGANPCFSPDGRQLGFTTDTGVTSEATGVEVTNIEVIDVTGSGRHAVASKGTFPVWSPDGRSIAFSADGFDVAESALFVIPAGGGRRKLIAYDNPISEDSSEFGVPDWQPRQG
jgi:Tol biopolymer transport system component